MRAWLLLLTLLLAGSLSANTSRSAPDFDPAAGLQLVGKSQMHWMFWKLYDIRLLSADGRYRPESYPLALVIRYAREIDREDLLEATLQEWRRLDLPWSLTWPAQLRQLWPSVTSGDELTLWVNAEAESCFYYNQVLRGCLSDPDFAPAFLSIWLSTETREPQIRRELLGESDA